MQTEIEMACNKDQLVLPRDFPLFASAAGNPHFLK